MISCLYFKVNHFFSFFFFLVHFMCYTLSFVIVELSQFVQTCIDGKQMTLKAWIWMWKSDQRNKKNIMKFMSLCVSQQFFSWFPDLYIYLAGCLLCMYMLNYRFNGRPYVLMRYELKINCCLSVLASVNGGDVRIEGVLWPRHCWAHDLD